MFNYKCVIKYKKKDNKPEEENKKEITQFIKEEILNFVNGQKQQNRENNQYKN
jgi:hypothetical protein